MTREEAARELVAQQLRELNELGDAVNRIGADVGWERLRRWKARTVDLLREHVHLAEADRLASTRMMSFQMNNPIGNLLDEARLYFGFLTALDDELQNHPESVLKAAVPETAEASAVTVPTPPTGSMRELTTAKLLTTSRRG